MLSKLCDIITNRLIKKNYKYWGGHLVFYIVFDNKLPPPNMFIHSVNPDFAEDDVLVELLKQVADRVRMNEKFKTKEIE